MVKKFHRNLNNNNNPFVCIGFLSTTSVSLEPENESGSEQKNLYLTERDNCRDVVLSLHDLINDIVDRETVEKCLNELIDIISIVDELVENVALIVIPEKEDLTSHSDDNINTEQEESLSSETELDQENIQANLPINELTPAPDTDNTPIIHYDEEIIQTEVLDDESVERSDTEDELSTVLNVVESPVEYPDSKDETSTLNNVVDLPIQHPDSKDETSTLKDVVELSIEHSDSEDELPTSTNIENTPIPHSDHENDEIKITDDELSTSTSSNETSIKHSDPKDEFPSVTNDIQSPIEHSDLNETQPITLEDSIKTPPHEFEDSFDELKTPNIQINRPPEDPSPQLTNFAALREFISNLEDDEDEDEDTFSSKQDIITVDKTVNNLSEQQNTPDITKDTISIQTSISEDIQEDNKSLSFEMDLSNDDQLIDTKNDNISTISTEQKLVEKKRFSIVNSHTIPPGAKINHMICSSTYIYICTIDRKVFYAKLHLDNTDLPLKWQQHSDLADQLVISVTNRTVWRLLNKRLYTSNDPIKFPPIGSQWNEIKLGDKQSLLSMSINDQCGWFIKDDGTLWLIRINDETSESLNVTCPFDLNTVFCFSEKVGVTTNDGQILIRVGCTNDCPEGDGWIFIQHKYIEKKI